jgi:hypothetical protein
VENNPAKITTTKVKKTHFTKDLSAIAKTPSKSQHVNISSLPCLKICSGVEGLVTLFKQPY